MHRRGATSAALGAILSVTLSTATVSALTADGDAFEVNVYTTANQIEPDVAALDGGGFVVVWESFGQDTSRFGVYGRMFDDTGDPDPDEFEVTEYTSRDQRRASVVGLADGGFVVVWSSNLRDGSGYGVFGQVFDEDGDPIEDEDFQVNTYTTGRQDYAHLAGQADGFVVVWQSTAQDGDAQGLFGQRFDLDGVRVGTEFQVSATTTDSQRTASVSAAADDTFWALWTSDPDGGTGQDGSNAGIFAQRFAANATRLGTELQVNTITTNDQVRPTVVAHGDGGFTAVWESRNLEAGAGTTDGVAVRRHVPSATGETEEQVNSYTSSFQEDAVIAALPGREMLVVWESEGGNAGGVTPADTNAGGVFARRLSAAGVPVGTEFQVNSYTTNEQDDPRVAALEDGRYVVVWESTAEDGSGGGIFGQLYEADDEVCGDADGDGFVRAGDALQVLRATTGTGTCTACVCDVDANGSVTAADALAVLKFATGSGSSLACESC